MNPFFSIIIPTYNREHMLPIAIQSVINQTCRDWELIIVDDGSTDNTNEVVASYNNDRIIYIYQANQERSVARNNGIKHAKGAYVCFLDSDDYYLPERLDLLYEEIIQRKKPIALLYTGICFEKDDIILKREEVLFNEKYSVFDFVIKAVIGVPQTCIAKQILVDFSFNPLFRIGEDMELWLRIVNVYPLVFIPDQNTVIATDHFNRSVNVQLNNVYAEVILMLNYIKLNYNFNFTKQVINTFYSDCYFGITKYFIFKNHRIKAIYNLIKSILYYPKGRLLKHKIAILIYLVISFKRVKKIIE